MAVPGLPNADSLLASIAALRRTLAEEESGFRATALSALSSDTNVTVVANGMLEVASVRIKEAAFPPVTSAARGALEAALRDAASKALAQADASTRPKAASDASAYTLAGIANANQPAPAAPNFASADADLSALLRAQDVPIAAKRFQGVSGPVAVIVSGALTITSLSLSDPLPLARDTLEVHVVRALNLALDKAKRLFEEALRKRVEDGVDPSAVSFPQACLYAHEKLQLADRVKVQRQDGSSAPVVNAGSAETNIGVEAQVGDLWSRGPVTLRNRAHVNGSLRTKQALTRQADSVVTGSITQNGMQLGIPVLGFSVTFPSTHQGDQTLAPDSKKALAPGAFGDVIVNARAVLSLSKGTYFFNKWTVEPDAIISCSSTTGQIIIHVKNGFIFRGSIVEKTGGRPKVFVGVFGTSVALGAPFTGTLVALAASVDLATVRAPGHTGAFYAKTITVQPGNTIVHFPFSGPPALTSG